MWNVRSASEFLQVSPATIYALCAAGQLRHVRIGLRRGAIRIPEEALTEYLERRSMKAPKPLAPKPPPVKLKHLV